MTPDAFYSRIVNPTLEYMAASPSIAIPRSKQADVLVIAIAGVESNWSARVQVPVGYARGFWQFEKGGGVAELFQKTPRQLGTVCASQEIIYEIGVVYEAMAYNDTLACAMARLLLWQDPAALPSVGDEESAYGYYKRNWRPGSPSRSRWAEVYPKAITAVQP